MNEFAKIPDLVAKGIIKNHLQCSSSDECPGEAYHKCNLCEGRKRVCWDCSEECKGCRRRHCLDHCVYNWCDVCNYLKVKEKPDKVKLEELR